MAQAAGSLPGWHGAPSLTYLAPKATDRGALPTKGLGDRFPLHTPPATALLFRAGTQISVPPQPGNADTSPFPAQVPLPLWHCSQIPPPKSLSKLTGYKLFIPFSLYSSLAGHHSQQLLPRTHTPTLRWEGRQRAEGRFWEQRGACTVSDTATQGGSSSTSNKEGNVSTVRTTSGAGHRAAVGQDGHAFPAKSWALPGKVAGREHRTS